MAKKLLTLGILAVLTVLAACDCGDEAKGVVLDRATGQPIQGATVDVYSPGKSDEVAKYQALTGADGSFQLKHDLCGDYMLTFHKPGYGHSTADASIDMKVSLQPEAAEP